MRWTVLIGIMVTGMLPYAATARHCHGHDDRYWADQYIFDGACEPRASKLDMAWDLFEQGRRLANCGLLAEAVSPIQEAIALEPKIGQFHLTQGLIFRDQGKRSEALKELQLAQSYGYDAVEEMATATLKDMGAGPAPGPTDGAPGSLYQRLGGEPAITAVVDDFISRVVVNPVINKRFDRQIQDPSALAIFRKHLIQQLCSATGGPQIYEGKDMKTTHEGLKIKDTEFDALVNDLVSSLNKFKVPNKDQSELLGLLGPMRKDIVERPGK
jgi:hemoglobin